MTRLQVLVSQPRLALGALLTLALASAAIVGSGADFTATSANPTNTFSSGTLSISNTKAERRRLHRLEPASRRSVASGTVDIGNSGTLVGAVQALARDDRRLGQRQRPLAASST